MSENEEIVDFTKSISYEFSDDNGADFEIKEEPIETKSDFNDVKIKSEVKEENSNVKNSERNKKRQKKPKKKYL